MRRGSWALVREDKDMAAHYENEAIGQSRITRKWVEFLDLSK